MRHPIVALLLLMAQISRAQIANPVQWLPATPTSADNVRLVFTTVMPNWGRRVSTNFVRSGRNLTFTGCYCDGPLTQPRTHYDTVSVGQLPVGVYNVTFITPISSDPTQCIELYRFTQFDGFRVTTPLSTRSVAPTWSIFPVPVVGSQLLVRLPKAETISSLQLVDATGRECIASPCLAQCGDEVHIELPPLSAGSYTLNAQLASGRKLTRRVVLQ